MQFRGGPQNGKVARPAHVYVLKVKDGFKAVGKVHALLSAPHTLLSGGRHLVGEIGVEQYDGPIARRRHVLLQQRQNAGIGADHGLRGHHEKDVVLVLRDGAVVVAFLIDHVRLAHGTQAHVVAQDALVALARSRLPVHGLQQPRHAAQLLGYAREDAHAHTLLHANADAQVLFGQCQSGVADEFEQGANAVAVHTGVGFGEEGDDLLSIGEVAVGAENDGVENGRGGLVVEPLADVTIVGHLI